MIQRWQIKNWAVAHKNLLAIALGFFLVLVFVGYWFGFTAKASNWWYSIGTEAAHEQLKAKDAEIAAAKAVVAESLRELAAEKGITAKLTAERELRDKIFADKSLTASQKLKAYEEAMAKPITVTPVTDDLDALCARAESLGIKCED